MLDMLTTITLFQLEFVFNTNLPFHVVKLIQIPQKTCAVAFVVHPHEAAFAGRLRLCEATERILVNGGHRQISLGRIHCDRVRFAQFRCIWSEISTFAESL